jgi:3-phenylpropionate/trans-cinnamate dioxygenase ferredoxin subunit
MDDNWIYVTDDGGLSEGTVVPVYPLGVNLILARIDGQVYALTGCCPHMGCPLFMGTLSGAILTCQCHDWRFDLRTGHFLDAPELQLKRYQTCFEDGKIFIKIN